MKKLNEEDFERLLNEQSAADGREMLPLGDNDAGLYKSLFSALADEPAGVQTGGLANAVIDQIKIQEQKAESLKYTLTIAAVLLTGGLFTYFSINYISPDTLKSWLGYLETYKWIFLFMIFSFAIIQVADKTLVKRKLAG